MGSEGTSPVRASEVVLTDAQQALVSANIALIYFVAGKYRQIPVAVFEDLIGKLYYRLCLSVARFDASRGLRISSYLVKCLNGEVCNFFRDEIWMVRPPRKLRQLPFTELIDSVGEDRSLAEREGEEREALRTAAIPVPLEGLTDPVSEEPLSAALMADVDVEREVTDRLAGPAIVREVYAKLHPEERWLLALLGKKAPEAKVMERFPISKRAVRAVWAELQAKAARYYQAALDGVWLPDSEGSATLTQLMKSRFVPPASGFVQVRAALRSSG